MKSKIIQITTAIASYTTNLHVLYALCEDGTVWGWGETEDRTRRGKCWTELKENVQ